MKKYLIDTNCFIYMLKGYGLEFVEWFDTLENEQIYLSNLVIFELLQGFLIKKNYKALRAIDCMIDDYNIVEFSLSDAIESAKTSANLRPKGIQCDSLDLHIASQAINNGLTLVTFNTKDFVNYEYLELKSFVF